MVKSKKKNKNICTRKRREKKKRIVHQKGDKSISVISKCAVNWEELGMRKGSYSVYFTQQKLIFMVLSAWLLW